MDEQKRNAKLAKIENKIKECEKEGDGKVVIFIVKKEIKTVQIIRTETLDND